MGAQQTVELRGAKFDDRARADLELIRSDTAADLVAYADAHASGDLDCLGVFVDGIRRGTMLVSWLDEGGLVFVCNALRVETIKGFDSTENVFALAHSWATDRGATKMRFWTAREGLRKRTEAWGFRTMFVMERTLHVGR